MVSDDDLERLAVRMAALLAQRLGELLPPLVQRAVAANPPQPRLALTVREFCQRYAFKERGIYDAIEKGLLRVTQPPGNQPVRIMTEDAEAYVKGVRSDGQPTIGVSAERRERRQPKRLRAPPDNGSALTPAKKSGPTVNPKRSPNGTGP